jgi:hypothetical protein
MLKKLRAWFGWSKHFDERLVQRDPASGQFTRIQIVTTPSDDPMVVDQDRQAREENQAPPLLQIPYRTGFAPRLLGDRNAIDWLRR